MEKHKSHDGFIPIGSVELYYRDIGRGQPMLILHGGPDFDHSYLLPELDQLSDSSHLIYYDQRGRGMSAANVQPENVSIQADVQDMDVIREYFHLETVTVLGHSWGGLLALEYAIRHPNRVSHLILLNSAPVSQEDYMLLQNHRLVSTPADIVELRARQSDVKYQQGDPDTVAEYYRVHFRATIKRPEHLETVVQRLRSSFTKEGILKARKIENHLMQETWLSDQYNLLPKLNELSVPTLIIHGEYDFIPLDCSSHIAQAIPSARIMLLEDCGHFSYLERPQQIHKAITDFLQAT